MCPAQGHITVTRVRLEQVAPRSGVKHSTTEPLGSQVDTVNSEIFTRILFSQIALKDLFATLKICV